MHRLGVLVRSLPRWVGSVVLRGRLSFTSLSVSLSRLCRTVKCTSTIPSRTMRGRIHKILKQIRTMASPHFYFFVSNKRLSRSGSSLSINSAYFDVNGVVAQRLHNSRSFTFFTTATKANFREFRRALLRRKSVMGICVTSTVKDIVTRGATSYVRVTLSRCVHSEK